MWCGEVISLRKVCGHILSKLRGACDYSSGMGQEWKCEIVSAWWRRMDMDRKLRIGEGQK